ncbi:hypothetical protein [Brachybacterium sp. GCM10030252]|uniref:hypothetical protein n=1 Tax=Brachybacterium sp. GCM10030252 TaxID=3273380 RepID=UPI003620C66D
MKVARVLEQVVRDRPGHVIVAGDLDAEPDADSVRFWTGRHVLEDMSVCYRSAAEAVPPARETGPTSAPGAGGSIETYLPNNPLQVDLDWPFRAIDHVLVRCGPTGPTLLARSCVRAFDTPETIASDHYGLVVDYEVPERHEADGNDR